MAVLRMSSTPEPQKEMSTAEWLSGFKENLLKRGFDPYTASEYVTEAFRAYVRDGGLVLLDEESRDA